MGKMVLVLLMAVAACGQTVVRLPGPRPGDKPEVVRREDAAAPAAPAAPVAAALKLEWPGWLAVPGNLSAQRSTPAGRMVTGSLNACPGDVVRKPSQGCLEKVFDTTERLQDIYGYIEDLLEEHGFTDDGPELGKSQGDTFGSLKMREYPEPQAEDRYRQVQVFLRELATTGRTKVEVSFLVKN